MPINKILSLYTILVHIKKFTRRVLEAFTQQVLFNFRPFGWLPTVCELHQCSLHNPQNPYPERKTALNTKRCKTFICSQTIVVMNSFPFSVSILFPSLLYLGSCENTNSPEKFIGPFTTVGYFNSKPFHILCKQIVHHGRPTVVTSYVSMVQITSSTQLNASSIPIIISWW